jgi:hypothetical protein
VISKLDVRLRTPTPPTVDNALWQSQTPSNTLEFGSQSKLVLERIQRHVDSSPTPMVDVIKSLSKAAEMMIHQSVLMRQRLGELQEAIGVLERPARPRDLALLSAEMTLDLVC